MNVGKHNCYRYYVRILLKEQNPAGLYLTWKLICVHKQQKPRTQALFKQKTNARQRGVKHSSCIRGKTNIYLNNLKYPWVGCVLRSSRMSGLDLYAN